jgi:hypothetical protein
MVLKAVPPYGIIAKFTVLLAFTNNLFGLYDSMKL